jgi:hypothetical protein
LEKRMPGRQQSLHKNRSSIAVVGFDAGRFTRPQAGYKGLCKLPAICAATT